MLESLFTKRRISYGQTAAQHEPAISKKVKHDATKPHGSGRRGASSLKVKDNLKGRIDSFALNRKGSKFRIMNEYLYKNDSKDAVEYFKENKELFNDYHEGFAQQMKDWPVNPLDVIIRELAKNPEYNGKVICDLGCGEGKLYEFFEKRRQILAPGEEKKTEEGDLESKKKAKNMFKKILSYDLVSTKSHITACDIAKLPLKNNSVDASIFCLALMGTNYIDFILEAQRTLSMGGHLIIAEVVSRLPDKVLFVKMIKALGFQFVRYIKKSTFFLIFIFKKNSNKLRKKTEKLSLEITDEKSKLANSLQNTTFLEASKILLEPCIYKRR